MSHFPSWILDCVIASFKQLSLVQHFIITSDVLVEVHCREKAGGVQVTELEQRHCGACMQAILTDSSLKTGQEREGCGVKQGGQFSPSPGAAYKPRGTVVLNPSRSLVPRPGQGRGEGREGGSSRPQRTPPNLERGQTKLSILY